MAHPVEHSQVAAAWQRMEALLDRMQDSLETLGPKSQLIGPEVIASLRQQHAELRHELNILRDAYPETAPESELGLQKLREHADRLIAHTTEGARKTYDRLRETAADPQTRQALKDGLGDLGRGAVRAGGAVGNAIATAVGRLRRGADKAPDPNDPSREPSGTSADRSDATSRQPPTPNH